MRKFVLFVLVLFASIALSAQNVYQNHPEMAKTDAEKLFREGKYEDAMARYKTYQALTGKNMKKEIGVAEACMKNRAESKDYFDRGDYTNALKSSLMLYSSNKSDEANISMMKKVLTSFVARKNSVSDPDLLNQLGLVYDDFSKNAARKSMIPDLQKALGLSGDKGQAYSVASELSKTNMDDAVPYYIIASDGDRDQAAESCLRLGDYYSGKRSYTEATNYYKKGVEKGSSACAFALGEYYRDRIDSNSSYRQSALNYYEKARELGNTLAKSRIEELGRSRQVTQSVSVVRRKTLWDYLEPEDDSTYYELGYSYQKQMNSLSLFFQFSYVSLGYTLGTVKEGFNSYVYFEDITDTGYKYTHYQPMRYVMVRPGIHLKYLLFDVGLGALACSTTSKTVVFNDSNSSFSPDDVEGIRIDRKLGGKNNDLCFAMQPRLALHYPFEDIPLRIGVHVGYSFVPRLPELSGICFGAGLALRFEM